MKKLDQVKEVTFETVNKLFDFIASDLITRNHEYGFRGHSDNSWKLEPTIIRYIDSIENSYGANQHKRDDLTRLSMNRLYKNFKDNLIVNNDLPQEKVESIDLWQYGQHFGLPSPLLDWTYSPYIALFFALESPIKVNKEVNCCIWVLNLEIVEYLNQEVRDTVRPKHKDKLSPEGLLMQQFPEMGIVSELNEYNRRLSYQQGFFTRHEYYRSVEVWLTRITNELDHSHSDQGVLEKYTFKCDEMKRIQMLDILDRMNINHRTLFPDINGSVKDAIESTTRSFQGPRVKHFSFSRL